MHAGRLTLVSKIIPDANLFTRAPKRRAGTNGRPPVKGYEKGTGVVSENYPRPLFLPPPFSVTDTFFGHRTFSGHRREQAPIHWSGSIKWVRLF